MSDRIIAVLLDLDGTLIESGGAGAESWRLAFDELYGVPADIAEFTDAGMTEPDVERLTFRHVVGRELNHFFSFGGYGSDSANRTALTRKALDRARTLLGGQLDRSEALVVGDTPHDVDAAHGAGVAAIGVATGRFSADDLRAAGADCVLKSLEEQFPLQQWAAYRSPHRG